MSTFHTAPTINNQEWNELYGIKKKDLNARDLWWSCVDMALEVSRIIVSSLLVIFVPQNCEGGTCSIKENFEELTDINKTAVGFNFITLGVLSIMYFIIYKREKFLIYRMDENPSVAKTHFQTVFQSNPEIELGVVWYNKLMFRSAICSILIYSINMIISAIVIFRDYYDGYQSVIQYLVNSGLCVYLMYKCITHSKSSLVLSNTSFVPITYNDVDPAYLEKRKKTDENAITL